MKITKRKTVRDLALAAVLMLLRQPTVAQEAPTVSQPAPVIVLTVSLPASTMHVGEDLVIRVITSNATDQIAYAGEGYGVGVAVELLNASGEDIGWHAMGGKGVEPTVVLHSNKLAIRPHSKDDFTWRFKPEPGYIVPGVYKLRMHRLDMKSKVDVYSNTVTLTVIP
jgi:hypothetical protein